MSGLYQEGKPQFFGVRGLAANIGQTKGDYTAALFQADYPQFYNRTGDCLLPVGMLQQFVDLANQAIQPDKWLERTRFCAGLFVAHYATMYLRTFAESSETPAQAAATGATLGVAKSASLGDASISYDTGALTAATEGWGSLNATQYGQMLATEARLVGMGGLTVI